MSEETLKQSPENQAVLQAIKDLQKEMNAQFEAIRQGIVDNNIRFDRLEGNFHLLRAEVTTLVEEVRHNRTVLV